MQFSTKDETGFFAYLNEVCKKNDINGPNSVTKNYDQGSGYVSIILTGQFLQRLETANKEDYELLLSKWG